MNPNAEVQVKTQGLENLDLNSLLCYQLVILCDQSLMLQMTVNNFCTLQNPPIKFISANTFGILCSVFCDLRCNKGSINNEQIMQNEYETIEKQIWNPRLINDNSGIQVPCSFSVCSMCVNKICCNPSQEILHLGLLCLYKFEEEFGRHPYIGNEKDHNTFLNLAESLKEKFSIIQIDKNLFELLLSNSKRTLPILSTFVGGIVSQEVLKSITKKFDHLNHWIHFCTPEIVNDDPVNVGSKNMSSICIDGKLLEKLKNINLFMVGCGSISCEILKNLALLNASIGQGKIIISDDSIIGKSHVTQHFLYSRNRINQYKSIAASEEILKVNSKMKIIPNTNKLSMETDKIYDGNFFKNQDIIIANVDNVYSRKYLDKCCIRNGKPWIDTGSMGFYGHVQVILPHLTENYTAVCDYSDVEYPYCTIKSFPMQIEHTVQWAYEKFLNLFIIKPSSYNEIWKKNNGINGIIERLELGERVNGLSTAIKLLLIRPKSWKDCVEFARHKFEKYFCNKAHQLLHLFPLDYVSDGKPFWQYPKCAPIPLLFEWKNALHRMFIVSTARLHAKLWNISYDNDDIEINNICQILNHVNLPQFEPDPNKKVVIAEDEKPEMNEEGDQTVPVFLEILRKEMESTDNECLKMLPLKFNKYDETEGQMDFIYSASNLRALMYNIKTESYLRIRFMTGKIIPSLPATNAVISALAVFELLKILKDFEKSQYSNYFIDLSQPSILLSEPASPLIYKLRKDLAYTVWDCWNIYGQKEETLQQFINKFKANFNLEPTMIVYGSKILWLPLIPLYEKRKSQTMKSLIDSDQERRDHAELSVSVYDENGEEEMAPSILYHF
ncbi:ubiquitin-like modifier-activating enzyme 6 [Centruroides sculpturatus]|uniref:ubiquitin-like modifier-activating enzyme 6 n=1 Tax=Centruroides sculpturatus TaxID=218467 RepID=UPI000C6CF573|nr:ubiquitin-like modifier-activating enzyme 6 [Centruroides sculpturatus]